jgi:hypothetical protein
MTTTSRNLPTFDDLLSRPSLLGRLRWRAQHGDRAAQDLLAQHDAAWNGAALDASDDGGDAA